MAEKNSPYSKTQDWLYLIFIYCRYNSVTISYCVTTSDCKICRCLYIPWSWIVRFVLNSSCKSCLILQGIFVVVFSTYLIVWKVSVFGVFLVCIFQHLNWIRRDTPYSVQIPKNTDQKMFEYGHFSRSASNSFLTNSPTLHHLKTPENQSFSRVCRNYKTGTLARNGSTERLFSKTVYWKSDPKTFDFEIIFSV